MAMSDIKTVWRPVKAWVDPVVAEICTTRRIYFVWGHNKGTSGEHPLGRALDFSILEYGNGVKDPGPARPELGEEIARYLWANRVRLNIWYVIWNRRWISTNPKAAGYNRWIPYTGKSPHTDHVHVSFNQSGVYIPPTSTRTTPPVEDDMPITDADARKVAAAVWAHRLNPGPYSERIGSYPPKATYPAGGLLVGTDAYGRESHRMWAEVLSTLAELAKPMTDQERSAAALAIAARVQAYLEAAAELDPDQEA